MESNIKLLTASNNRLMAFRGEIKAERWYRVLNDVDDFTLKAIQEIMGEEHFKQEFYYRVNCDIPTEFSAILLRAGTCKSEVILLGLMLFKEEFLGLFEIAIGSIDERLMIPFPEDYGNKDDNILRKPILMVREDAKFNE
ncbi:hypothetical protein SUGI_0116930 [Cryptomeria japonica]|nr:hypothetical protein SUGI_0116930 [Cryptomeria japonica]